MKGKGLCMLLFALAWAIPFIGYMVYVITYNQLFGPMLVYESIPAVRLIEISLGVVVIAILGAFLIGGIRHAGR